MPKYFLLIFVLFLSACSTYRGLESPEEAAVLDSLSRNVEAGNPATELLLLEPEAKAQLDNRVDRSWNELRRFRELRSFLFDEEGLHIQYAPEATQSANGTFETREGNCLSLSTLFIASARYLDIDAGFETVKVRPTWDQEGTTMIRYEHIVATGVLNRGDDYIVDFLPEFTAEDYLSSKISDEHALALFYNNLGAEAVVNGQYEQAEAQLLKAIRLWPENSDPWNNLGATYKRLGEMRLSELSFKRALNLERNNYSALANLTQLYLAQDRRDEAQEFLQRVNRYYRRNPYFHYYLAKLHQREGKYEESVGYLNSAVRLKKDEPDFLRALASTHRRLGNEDLAKNYAERADKMSNRLSSRSGTERRAWLPNVFITR